MNIFPTQPTPSDPFPVPHPTGPRTVTVEAPATEARPAGQPIPRPRGQRDDRGTGVDPQRLADHNDAILADVPPVPDLDTVDEPAGGWLNDDARAFTDSVADWIARVNVARRERVVATLAAIDEQNNREELELESALRTLHARMVREPLPGLLRDIAAVAYDPATQDAAPVITDMIRDALLGPCPDWCTRCVYPDPGVVDHYGPIFSGGSQVDTDAEWQLQITQRVIDGVPDRAMVDILHATGAYDSLAGFVAALLEAQAAVDRINAEVGA